MKSKWHLPSEKPENGRKIEFLYDKNRPTEIDTWDNGFMSEYYSWDEVILWRYYDESAET